MKLSTKQIGCIIGLVCVVICVIMILTMCTGSPVQESTPTGESTEASETTEMTTEATTEPSEETTEEATEETTEETTESELNYYVPSTNTSVGSPGSTGSIDEEDTTATEPTKPVEQILDPGTEGNPYSDVVTQFPGEVETVNIPVGGAVHYAVYYADGTKLTIEDANAYVVYNGVTYESVEGVVTVELAYAYPGAPAQFQVGSKAEAEMAYDLLFTAPLGSPSNPEAVETIESLPVAQVKYNEDGYSYTWTPAQTGYLTVTVSDLLAVSEVVEGMEAADPVYDVILRVGSTTIKLSEAGVTDEATGVTSVTIAAYQDTPVTIQAVVSADEYGNPYPQASLTLNGSFTADPAATNGEEETESTTPTEPEETEPTEPTESEGVNYTVVVTDYDGGVKTNVVVQFLKDGEVVAMQPVNAKGVATATLASGDYTVALVFSGEALYYEDSAAVVTAEVPKYTAKVTSTVTTTYQDLYVGKAYDVSAGGTYVTMQSNVVNYFIFTPTESGTYQFTTSDPEAVISYWGASTAYIADMTSGTDYKDNVFTLNIKESNLGAAYILGITGAKDCILEITRTGDAVLDDSDVEPEIYELKKQPEAYTLTLSSGQELTYVDLTAKTSAYELVLNTADGYYHLGSKNGPVMYVDLGPDAPYVSMYNLLGFTGFGGTSLSQRFYDEEGKLLRKEDYTEAMMAYVECIDETYGVYPLDEDLAYMLQQAGDFKGWWDETNGNYLFEELEGFNPELGWMFACCYIQ